MSFSSDDGMAQETVAAPLMLSRNLFGKRIIKIILLVIYYRSTELVECQMME